MKILIVEDEEALALVLHEKLKKSGFEATIAKDGQMALQMIRSEKPEVILLDLMLPVKNGFEVLEEIKEDPELRLIPVVVLSNLGEDDDIKRAISLGAKDYFVKSQHPINEVVEKVKNFRIAAK